MTPRAIPGWLAAIVEALELDQKRLVTLGDVRAIRPDLDRAAAHKAVEQLIRLGWLHRTAVRGTYEFVPGAAAGPYPSGDPWLVLRAEVARHPDSRPGAIHAGANSAAWLLGYAERSPAPHIVVAETGTWVPRPLRATYRVLMTSPAPASGAAQGIPVPSPPELFAEVAQLAPRLQLDAAVGWLSRLLGGAPTHEVAGALADRSTTTRARAGFIAEVCGATAHADAIESIGSVGRGPFYTGPPRRTGVFSPRWRVYDSGHIARASWAPVGAQRRASTAAGA